MSKAAAFRVSHGVYRAGAYPVVCLRFCRLISLFASCALVKVAVLSALAAKRKSGDPGQHSAKRRKVTDGWVQAAPVLKATSR